jgi:O-acetyl-ADP-ribose deacetylase
MHAERTVEEVVIEVEAGDITDQPDFDVVVNAANSQLLPGAGVAGAIHAKAGPGLVDECRPLAPISTGNCVLTSGHGLPNRWVIHCLGPVYAAEAFPAELLAKCYSQALELADKKGLASIAFPAISTGVFGYPLAESATIALASVAKTAPRLSNVRRVRFVLFGEAAFSAYEKALDTLPE